MSTASSVLRIKRYTKVVPRAQPSRQADHVLCLGAISTSLSSVQSSIWQKTFENLVDVLVKSLEGRVREAAVDFITLQVWIRRAPEAAHLLNSIRCCAVRAVQSKVFTESLSSLCSLEGKRTVCFVLGWQIAESPEPWLALTTAQTAKDFLKGNLPWLPLSLEAAESLGTERRWKITQVGLRLEVMLCLLLFLRTLFFHR